jgi:hypothetical protein
MELSRRTFLRSGVAAATAMAVGIPVSRVASAAAAETEQDRRWDKGGGRFCGVGCGIMIATQEGQIVATKGDPMPRSIEHDPHEADPQRCALLYPVPRPADSGQSAGRKCFRRALIAPRGASPIGRIPIRRAKLTGHSSASAPTALADDDCILSFGSERNGRSVDESNGSGGNRA